MSAWWKCLSHGNKTSRAEGGARAVSMCIFRALHRPGVPSVHSETKPHVCSGLPDPGGGVPRIKVPCVPPLPLLAFPICGGKAKRFLEQREGPRLPPPVFCSLLSPWPSAPALRGCLRGPGRPPMPGRPALTAAGAPPAAGNNGFQMCTGPELSLQWGGGGEGPRGGPSPPAQGQEAPRTHPPTSPRQTSL